MRLNKLFKLLVQGRTNKGWSPKNNSEKWTKKKHVSKARFVLLLTQFCNLLSQYRCIFRSNKHKFVQKVVKEIILLILIIAGASADASADESSDKFLKKTVFFTLSDSFMYSSTPACIFRV